MKVEEESLDFNEMPNEQEADNSAASLAECERIVALEMQKGEESGGHLGRPLSNHGDSPPRSEFSTTVPGQPRVRSDVPVTDMLFKKFNAGREFGSTAEIRKSEDRPKCDMRSLPDALPAKDSPLSSDSVSILRETMTGVSNLPAKRRQGTVRLNDGLPV